MNEGVVVKQSFINAVRTMLIGLAFEGTTPTSQIFQEIDPARQFCEGYLGVQRDRIKSMNPAEIREVLEVCGLPLNE
jgi:hypothetical protein